MHHAFRLLAKSPGFTAVAVLTLALGIGLNTSMFTVLNTFLLQPLPYPDKDHLVRIYRTTPQTQSADHTALDYVDLKRALKPGLRIAGYRPWGFTMALPDRPAVHLNALRVSAEFFPLIGLQPELGRYFTVDEDAPGNQVIIISHETWKAQFAGDPTVIGRSVRVDGGPMTIIGVTPPEFSSLFLWGPGDAFRPLAITKDELTFSTDTGVQILGRLDPPISVPQINSQLATIVEHLAENRPRERRHDGLAAVPLQETTANSGTRGLTWMLLGLSGFVLLIACANLANLQLARTLARSQEFAVRAALGASRAQLLRPVLIESLMLSAAGGGIGVLVAQWANDWIGSQISANAPVTFALTMNWRVLLFAAIVSTATGVLFGLVPASLLSRVRVNDTLKTGGRGNTHSRAQLRLRHSLIVLQFAMALVLLAGASVFYRAFNRMLQREVGWNHHSMVQGIIDLPGTKYSSQEKLIDFYTRLQERIGTLAGVENVAIAWTLPVFQFLTTRACIVEGRAPPSAGHEPMAYVNGVTPSYLPTLKTRLLAGRNFDDRDTASSTKVAIISESMARALFPNENPVGHRIGNTDPAHRDWAEIVGVIPDQRFAISVATPATRFLVLKPITQEAWGYVTFAARAAAPETLVNSIRRTVAELDPDIPVQQLNTVDEFVRLGSSGFVIVNQLLAAFAVLGLFLSSLGLYGVITRLVVQRTPEFGVRIALGALPTDVIGLVLRAGVRLSLIGTAVGLFGAFGLSRAMSSFMPELPLQDGTTICVVAVLLLVVALVACWLPARRASRIDPLIALRAE